MAETLQGAAGIAAALWAGRIANHQRPGTPWIDRIAVGMLGTVGVMAALAVPLSRLPVVVDVRAEVVSHEPGLVAIHVWATKPPSRTMCEYLLTDAYVIDPGGALLSAVRTVPTDPRPGNTRPAGPLDFGVWRVAYPPSMPISGTTFFARHQCGWWLRPTVTEIGPFPLGPLEKQ